MSNPNLLVYKGIISPTGEVNKDKINLLSGAFTQPLVDSILATTNYDKQTIIELVGFLQKLFVNTQRAEMLELLNLLYRLEGLHIPQEIQALKQHSEARDYFLFSFLLDVRDVLEDC